MRELHGHVTEEWFCDWQNKKLSVEEERQLLLHVASCDYCAERFAQTLENDLYEPPAYLREEILERSQGLDVQAAKTVYQTSRQMRLFLYSLKVGLAVVTSLFLLFCTTRIDPEMLRMEAFRTEWMQDGEERSSVIEILDERSGKVDQYLQKLTERLFDQSNKEERYD